MFMQLGLNISDVASFYTQNITNMRKVYDTDSTASPTATFLDSIFDQLRARYGRKSILRDIERGIMDICPFC